eukprot:146664-Amphidinium_carterae.1
MRWECLIKERTASAAAEIAARKTSCGWKRDNQCESGLVGVDGCKLHAMRGRFALQIQKNIVLLE